MIQHNKYSNIDILNQQNQQMSEIILLQQMQIELKSHMIKFNIQHIVENVQNKDIKPRVQNRVKQGKETKKKAVLQRNYQNGQDYKDCKRDTQNKFLKSNKQQQMQAKPSKLNCKLISFRTTNLRFLINNSKYQINHKKLEQNLNTTDLQAEQNHKQLNQFKINSILSRKKRKQQQ